jgi:hypothetical protein
MKSGHIDTGNYYHQRHDSAFALVGAFPPIAPADDPGKEGMMRYNQRRKVFEGYINSEWSELVTDAALFGNNSPSGSGNVTKEALKNILGQLFRTTDGTVHVIHGGGSQFGDGYGISPGDIEPLPSYITSPPLTNNTVVPAGIWPEGGNNFIVCNNQCPTRSVNGGIVVDLPGLFKMAKGPKAEAVGGVGAVLIVGTKEGTTKRVEVVSGGTGYSVGSAVNISPGAKYDEAASAYILAGTGATAVVDAVDAVTGEITSVEVTSPGSEYPPEEKFNYIFDVVSGLAGNSDETGSASKTQQWCDFSTHALPKWTVSPDMTLLNNLDDDYGKYMFSIEAQANQTGTHGFFITCKFICTLYKFKEFSNLV